MNKRNFIKTSSFLTLGAVLMQSMSLKPKSSLTIPFNNRTEPFNLPNLPYAFNALEPNIDTKTMEIHHGKHHAGYVTKLNEAIQGTRFENASLESILSAILEQDPAAIRNNAGGHYNHSMFWESMTPNGNVVTDDKMMKAIDSAFGSIDKFKEQFTTSAKNVFGSGWTWLCVDKNKKLFITNTPNQDNPLMSNIVKSTGIPILGLDIWEHAYYLNYQNKRADYIANFFNVINWKKVEERYSAALKSH